MKRRHPLLLCSCFYPVSFPSFLPPYHILSFPFTWFSSCISSDPPPPSLSGLSFLLSLFPSTPFICLSLSSFDPPHPSGFCNLWNQIDLQGADLFAAVVWLVLPAAPKWPLTHSATPTATTLCVCVCVCGWIGGGCGHWSSGLRDHQVSFEPLSSVKSQCALTRWGKNNHIQERKLKIAHRNCSSLPPTALTVYHLPVGVQLIFRIKQTPF